MKIRYGFVSNSSSASFVIEGRAFPNIATIAKLMISLRHWKGDKKLIAKINALMKNKTIAPDTPLKFSTCNYDTYILKEEGYYFIATCNNHGAFFDIPCFGSTRDSKILKIVGIEDMEEMYKIEEDYNFYFLEEDIMGKRVGRCNELSTKRIRDCFGKVINVSEGLLAGKNICLECKKINPKLKN